MIGFNVMVPLITEVTIIFYNIGLIKGIDREFFFRVVIAPLEYG